MRYNAPEHLTAFKEKGRFPKIHDPFREFFRINDDGARSVLDLCCCFGLLGESLKQAHPTIERVVGVEALESQVLDGRAAGVQMPMVVMKVDLGHLGDFLKVIEDNKVDTIVCRRGLSEVFVRHQGNKPLLDSMFAKNFSFAIARAGVRQFFTQGRTPVANATWPVPDVEAEVEGLSAAYRLVEKSGELAYLVRAD